ncbi:MAG: nucleotidyl transferase AbiEii/AbiGii toxin family protein [Candidatus Neomarinimicrobiota bacterium]
MNKHSIQEWLKLSDRTKIYIFTETSTKTGLPAIAIEKDWWVVKTLEVIFNTEIADHTVFKGGTSLSKAWGLIERFSEDIDLALDRKFLGFDQEMTTSQVKKLRKDSFRFISEKYYPALEQAFHEYGLRDVKLELADTTANDQDPLIIIVHYTGLIEKSEYIQSRILIEIGSRSLREPFTVMHFRTLVGEHFPGKPFTDNLISIPTVNPERTFLEKIFLLHEEFQKPNNKIKVNRLSRHLYDVEKMMDTKYARKALSGKTLYQHIVEHRRTITPIRGINYENHNSDKINPIPPESIWNDWKQDYNKMQRNMIYGDSLSFNELIDRIRQLKEKINNLPLTHD